MINKVDGVALKKRINMLLSIAAAAFVVIGGYRLFFGTSHHAAIIGALFSTVSLALVYGLVRTFSGRKSADFRLSRLLHVQGSIRYMVVALIGCMFLAFLWPTALFNLVDRNTLAGTLILIVPSIALLLASTFFVARILLHVIAGWFSNHE